ncbi:tetratricopeptide repeat protein, partial [bacterium]|nr:tetratricopeptide repeat protein [bacterium]
MGVEVPDHFDGTIGSIVMDLDAMKKRFREAGSEEKTILRVLQQLYFGGVYRGRQEFPLEWVKPVSASKGLPIDEYKWDDEWLEGLVKKEFLKRQGDIVEIEEAYLLPDVFEPALDMSPDFLTKLIEPLSGVPEAMRKLGGRAYDLGLNDREKKNYMKVAIVAYTDALECISKEEDGEEFADIQNNLGIALGNLGEIEDKAMNSRRAIAAFEEALKVRTLKDFPMDYATTQNNLGNAYGNLGDVENKAENCHRAIAAYEEALKVRTLEDFPMDYAMTQNNLG